MTDSLFRVPLALDDADRIVRPEDATRDHRYRCPSCVSSLVLRDGEVRSKHFAHPATSSCSAETVLHATGKRAIAERVQTWLDGKADAPTLLLECSACGDEEPTELPRARVDEVVLEHRLPGGVVPDVVLRLNGVPTLGVEIRATHAVDAVKAAAYPIAWVELEAEAVLRNPSVWGPLQSRLTSISCTDCKAAMANVKRTCESTKVALPSAWSVGRRPARGYAVDIVACWKCHERIPVFDWGARTHSTDPPPEPRPRVVQFRFSKTAEQKYWMNVCACCGSTQGDIPLRHVQRAFEHRRYGLTKPSVGMPVSDAADFLGLNPFGALVSRRRRR